MKTIHVHITLWVILLVGGFLLGFVPEYLKNRELAAQLESPLKTIDALKLQLEFRFHVVGSFMQLEQGGNSVPTVITIS